MATIQGYEELYDKIQSVTNDINNVLGSAMMDNSIKDETSVKLINEMRTLASKLSSTSHELEEHLAWDEIN